MNHLAARNESLSFISQLNLYINTWIPGYGTEKGFLLVPFARESFAPVSVSDGLVFCTLAVLNTSNSVKLEDVVIELSLSAEHTVQLAPHQNT